MITVGCSYVSGTDLDDGLSGETVPFCVHKSTTAGACSQQVRRD